MKQPSMKNLKVARWTTAQLVHLSESFDQSYGTGEIAKGNKVSGASWRYQQLLDMSAAKAQPFI